VEEEEEEEEEEQEEGGLKEATGVGVIMVEVVKLKLWDGVGWDKEGVTAAEVLGDGQLGEGGGATEGEGREDTVGTTGAAARAAVTSEHNVDRGLDDVEEAGLDAGQAPAGWADVAADLCLERGEG